MRRLALGALAIGGAALGGCGADRDAAFRDIQQSVSERTGARTHWYLGTAEDVEAAQAVRGLLAQELTVAAAVQIALLNNRSLQATYEELGVAQADLVRAGLLRNPVFNADAKFGDGRVKLEFSLLEDFLDVLFIPMRKRIAASALDGARLRVTGAAIDLAGEVRSTAYRLQVATQTVAMRRTVIEALSAAYELAERLRAAGNITPLELAEQRLPCEEAKLACAEAETQVAELRERMDRLLGLWGNDTAWTFVAHLGDLPAEADEASLDQVERRAIERSLDLAIGRAEIAQAAQRLGIAKPFGVVGEADLGVAAEKELDGTWAIGPAVSVPLPLFNQGQPAISAARSDLRRSQDRYAAQAIEIRSRARLARDRVMAARARVAYLQQVILPLHQSMVAEWQQQYNGMLASAFRLIEAKQQEIDAGARLIRSLGDYWCARSDLDQLLNGRLPAADADEGGRR